MIFPHMHLDRRRARAESSLRLPSRAWISTWPSAEPMTPAATTGRRIASVTVPNSA